MSQHPGLTTDRSSVKPTGRIVIAGGTGFLGLNLASYLADAGCEVVLISRHRAAGDSRWHHAQWDARTLGDWVRHLDGAGALVTLYGRYCVSRRLREEGFDFLFPDARSALQNLFGTALT